MLTFANQLETNYREETLNGVEYLVVPGIPIQEQVLKYYFVNAAEIGKFVLGWNGIPLTINHPQQNNGSANVPTPDVPVVGTFYNAVMDGLKLTGEYWFDLVKLRASAAGLVIEKAVRNNRLVETSTGYFAEEVPTAGEYAGVSYTAVHQNIHPDHIAILPETIGACSVADGCGLPRLNCSQNCAACATKKNEEPMPESEPSLLDKLRELLHIEAQPAVAQNAATPPVVPEVPVPAQNAAAPVVVLNAEEYAYVRAYISLSADLGGVENIKSLLLLMQKAQENQLAQEADELTRKAAELAPVTADVEDQPEAMTNQANPEPVNYAGAVTPVVQSNAAQGLTLPVAIPFKL